MNKQLQLTIEGVQNSALALASREPKNDKEHQSISTQFRRLQHMLLNKELQSDDDSMTIISQNSFENMKPLEATALEIRQYSKYYQQIAKSKIQKRQKRHNPWHNKIQQNQSKKLRIQQNPQQENSVRFQTNKKIKKHRNMKQNNFSYYCPPDTPLNTTQFLFNTRKEVDTERQKLTPGLTLEYNQYGSMLDLIKEDIFLNDGSRKCLSPQIIEDSMNFNNIVMEVERN